VKKISLFFSLRKSRIVSMSNKPPIIFDLSVARIPGTAYQPPKAWNAGEIERRRQLTPGELVYEYQAAGLRVARRTLELLMTADNPRSREFAMDVIAVSGLNSVWYSMADPDRGLRQRKVIPYPYLPTAENGTALLRAAHHKLHVAEASADRLTQSYGARARNLSERRRDFGQPVGEASLALAVVSSVGDATFPWRPLDAQMIARESGTRLLERRLDLVRQIDTAPSLAQLADPDSDISVLFRRGARRLGAHEAYNAFEQATQEMPRVA
jgi:hypothetical protein